MRPLHPTFVHFADAWSANRTNSPSWVDAGDADEAGPSVDIARRDRRRRSRRSSRRSRRSDPMWSRPTNRPSDPAGSTPRVGRLGASACPAWRLATCRAASSGEPARDGDRQPRALHRRSRRGVGDVRDRPPRVGDDAGRDARGHDDRAVPRGSRSRASSPTLPTRSRSTASRRATCSRPRCGPCPGRRVGCWPRSEPSTTCTSARSSAAGSATASSSARSWPQEPGEPPYPDVMNGAVIEELRSLAPDAVVVKGDLTNLGTEEEYERFRTAYDTLGPTMHHVRGNHDAMVTTDDRLRSRPVRGRAARRPARGARHRHPRHRHGSDQPGPGRVARRSGRRGRSTGAGVRTPPPVGSRESDPFRDVLRDQPRRQRRARRASSSDGPRSPGTSPATPIGTGCADSPGRGRCPWWRWPA